MLVVTGTQRSGTSVIAKALIESGYDLGSNWYDEEAQGGYENELICGFYREYLGDPSFPFDDFDLPLAGRYGFSNYNPQVIKFSYLLMNPAFVTIWHKFRAQQDTFLVMSRHKEHVIKSKLRLPSRFKHDSPLLTQTPEALMWNFHTSLVLLDRLGYKGRLLPFPDCLHWRVSDINRRLTYLDPSVQIWPKVWKEVVDLDKVHF